MTINKAQGQTFNRLGLYLPNPVFAHGQLYVAFSRATSFDHIYVQMKNGPNKCIESDLNARTVNVVLSIHT